MTNHSAASIERLLGKKSTKHATHLKILVFPPGKSVEFYLTLGGTIDCGTIHFSYSGSDYSNQEPLTVKMIEYDPIYANKGKISADAVNGLLLFADMVKEMRDASNKISCVADWIKFFEERNISTVDCTEKTK